MEVEGLGAEQYRGLGDLRMPQLGAAAKAKKRTDPQSV
jgi:hypothetical protein